METVASVEQTVKLPVMLLNVLFRRRSTKTSKLRVTGLCVGNSPVTGEFPAQMVSNAENVSIWWRHHDIYWTGTERALLHYGLINHLQNVITMLKKAKFNPKMSIIEVVQPRGQGALCKRLWCFSLSSDCRSNTRNTRIHSLVLSVPIDNMVANSGPFY